MVWVATLFPEPDSPTMPSVRPRSTANEMPRTACTTPSAVLNETARSCTSSRLMPERYSRRRAIHASISSGRRGRLAERLRWPVSVTTTSSSTRTPIPRSSAGQRQVVQLEIEARLHRQHLPGLEDAVEVRARASMRAVVDVEPEHVPRSTQRVAAVQPGVRAQRLRGRDREQTPLGESLGHCSRDRSAEVTERPARLNGGEPGFVSDVDELEHAPLRRREDAADGQRPRQVGRVQRARLDAEVEKEELFRMQRSVVARPVECRRVRTTGDDRVEREPVPRDPRA